MLDEKASVGTHSKRSADRFGCLSRANRDGDYFARLALLLEPNGFLNRDLVERIDRHLDVGEIDARTVGLHPYRDVEIDHPLDGDENLHRVNMPCADSVYGRATAPPAIFVQRNN